MLYFLIDLARVMVYLHLRNICSFCEEAIHSRCAKIKGGKVCSELFPYQPCFQTSSSAPVSYILILEACSSKQVDMGVDR